MTQPVLIRDETIAWEDVAPERKAMQRAGDPGLQFKRLLPYLSGRPNVQRTQYHPGHLEAPHSHPEDELIFVLDGVLCFGREELRVGDGIFMPKDTTYSLHTGETGAQFLRVGLADLAGPQTGG